MIQPTDLSSTALLMLINSELQCCTTAHRINYLLEFAEKEHIYLVMKPIYHSCLHNCEATQLLSQFGGTGKFVAGYNSFMIFCFTITFKELVAFLLLIGNL